MFCRNCGEVILETDITCPNCGFAAGAGLKYCAHCGSETPPGAMICEICGNAVSAMPSPEAQQFQQQYQRQPDYRQTPPPPTFQQPPFQQQTYHQPTASPFRQNNAQQQYRNADPNSPYAQQSYGQTGAYQQPNAAGQQYYGTVTYKSKVKAGLLGIFLGMLGVHNFYLGYTAKGVIQLLMTLCSCGFLGTVSWIWGIVEGIMLLTGAINQDGKGLPLKE